MPISIRTNILNARNPGDTNYTGIDAVSDQTTADRVAEINSAGTTQLNAVNNAGTTKLNAVNNAGTTQVAAVNARGNYYMDNVIAPSRVLDEDDLGIDIVAGTATATTDRIDSVATSTATTVVENWLSNLDPATSVIVDETLSISGAAADAKVTGDDIVAIQAMIAAPYSSSATYTVGNYCIYGNKLYRCSTAISIAEAWTAAHWSETTIAEILTYLAER